jgi:hypothetical protein
MMVHTWNIHIQETEAGRQEDREFKTSLGYTARSHLKINE